MRNLDCLRRRFITKEVNPFNLIRPRVELECEGVLMEDGLKFFWRITCRSGWPMDAPSIYRRYLSKAEARKIAVDFLTENTIIRG